MKRILKRILLAIVAQAPVASFAQRAGPASTVLQVPVAGGRAKFTKLAIGSVATRSVATSVGIGGFAKSSCITGSETNSTSAFTFRSPLIVGVTVTGTRPVAVGLMTPSGLVADDSRLFITDGSSKNLIGKFRIFNVTTSNSVAAVRLMSTTDASNVSNISTGAGALNGFDVAPAAGLNTYRVESASENGNVNMGLAGVCLYAYELM